MQFFVSSYGFDQFLHIWKSNDVISNRISSGREILEKILKKKIALTKTIGFEAYFELNFKKEYIFQTTS